MRDIKRIDRILKLLRELWMKNPDQRFGQFLITYGIAADDIMVWAREDDELEQIFGEIVFNNHKKWNAKPINLKKRK